MMRPEALLFDVFGTCVDWRTGVAEAVRAAFGERDIAADPFDVADAWRSEYQPAMETIRSGLRAYVDLDVLHRENLDRVLTDLGLADRFEAAGREALTKAWEHLPPWPDVPDGLRRMRRLALIAPCSNASIALSARLAKAAGLEWDCVLGAGFARAYKPQPIVYQASCAALRLDPHEVMMVAAHNDDLDAARYAGLRTAFVPRREEHGPDQLTDMGPEGDWEVVAEDFTALARMIEAMPATGDRSSRSSRL